ncbi:gliding motility-associated C-terminal domain-containing protein [Dyadobacter sp. CY261]|uniref:Ig-like domain-containing protein n=1 Tax=Dyadobacter sp. CY261 TaxID=2907203 RepID=UPI001F16D5DF|nr:gliding motility-associated C-terminal domain-containing protein [Dyadobacter sp. CY261]MCF0072920.1 gliding motility-associated C-terminal domain-containing protein [Dyadobacter sp. CY261]
MGQDLSGYWQGMDFGPRPDEVTFWPTALELTQNGSTINGSCFQQVTSQTPYFVEWKISGASVNSNVGQMQFAEITAMNVAQSAPCDSKYSFTYYPDEERLLGMREFECGMKLTMDLYRMRLKSRDIYCKGETATLQVTGKDIRWYADPQKSKWLHTGNTYETKVTQTDTFYVTQIFHAVETPPVPVIIKVSEPSITNLQVTHTSCDQDNGIISVTATGDGPMTDSLDNGMFQSVSVFPGLYAKTYQLTVKSGAGCPVSREVTVEKRTRPTFLMVVATNSCTSESGGILAQAQGGYGPLTYALDNQPFRESGVFSDLQSGEYMLRAKDSLGCEISMAVKVADKNDAVVLQEVEIEHARCGAEFGGFTVIATGTGELQYSLDGENYVTSPNFSYVTPGAYEVFVKDPGGCMASKKIVIGKAPAPEFLNIIEYNASCKGNDGAISIHAIGNGPLLFSIDAINFVPDTVFNGLSPLVQTVYMVDTAGCHVARSLYIREICLENVYIPTAFSPDFDGKNEVMELKFATGKLRIRHFRLFNRWGTVVASRSDQTVESGYALWDGFYKGDRAQPGAYPYELTVEFDDGRTRVIRDTILLLR